MKYFIQGLLVLTAIVCVMLGCDSIENHYTKKGIIVHIYNDTVTVEDNKGQLWEFVGTGYEVNQQVKMTMYTNHTDSRQDDIVQAVKIVLDKQY